MKNQPFDTLLESFSRNGRVNAALLSAITAADLTASDGQGGWNVGQHLGHLAEFRYEWLTLISPEHAAALPSVLEGDEQGFHLTTNDIAVLAGAFSAGDGAALTAVTRALEENMSFKGAYESHPVHFLQHILVHDAHHRGQVVSLLRRSGWPSAQLVALENALWPSGRE